MRSFTTAVSPQDRLSTPIYQPHCASTGTSLRPHHTKAPMPLLVCHTHAPVRGYSRWALLPSSSATTAGLHSGAHCVSSPLTSVVALVHTFVPFTTPRMSRAQPPLHVHVRAPTLHNPRTLPTQGPGCCRCVSLFDRF